MLPSIHLQLHVANTFHVRSLVFRGGALSWKMWDNFTPVGCRHCRQTISGFVCTTQAQPVDHRRVFVIDICCRFGATERRYTQIKRERLWPFSRQCINFTNLFYLKFTIITDRQGHQPLLNPNKPVANFPTALEAYNYDSGHHLARRFYKLTIHRDTYDLFQRNGILSWYRLIPYWASTDGNLQNVSLVWLFRWGGNRRRCGRTHQFFAHQAVKKNSAYNGTQFYIMVTLII